MNILFDLLARLIKLQPFLCFNICPITHLPFPFCLQCFTLSLFVLALTSLLFGMSSSVFPVTCSVTCLPYPLSSSVTYIHRYNCCCNRNCSCNVYLAQFCTVTLCNASLCVYGCVAPTRCLRAAQYPSCHPSPDHGVSGVASGGSGPPGEALSAATRVWTPRCACGHMLANAERQINRTSGASARLAQNIFDTA